jgi:glycine oxidase
LKQDFFIIGAGVAGLSAARALAQQGAGITIADGGHPGQSSWAGAGIVCPLMPWDYSEEMNRMALAGMQAWPEWASALENESGIDPEFWVCGMEAAGSGDGDAALAWCGAHGFAAEKRPDNRLWLPDVAQVRNPRLLDALSGSVTALGCNIRQNCKIDGLRSQDRRVTAVLSGSAQYQADLFVLSTGAWSGQLLEGLAPVPNIRPVRGQMLLYAPGSHTLDHILYRDGLYLVPRKDGHLLAGSTLEDAGFDPATTPEALARLHQAACKLLPELAKYTPIRSWAGLRPGSPDNVPLIDRHPDYDNLWIHTGHFRYGVTMAPASSRLLMELMLGKTPHLDPAPYSWRAALQRNWPDGKTC